MSRFCISRLALPAGVAPLAGLLCLLAFAAHATPPSMDDLELNAATDGDLFKPRHTGAVELIIGQARLGPTRLAADEGQGGIRVSALLDVAGISAAQPLGDLNNLFSDYQSQGLKISRLNAAWQTEDGTLTVGDDWSNFEDFSPASRHAMGAAGGGLLFEQPRSAEQIAWAGRNGFSIALEEGADGEWQAASENLESLQALSVASPSLVLSWQGRTADYAGQYMVSAIGRKLELDGAHQGVEVHGNELGWGLKLAGGWRFGDLVAALSVTLGNGIDSLILGRFGSDVAMSESGRIETVESLSILPSLNYNIDPRSDFHVALGRYVSQDDAAITGIETLDTINLGYTWSPWPSAKFGIEVVGKDTHGALEDGDSTEVKIGAEQRF